MRFRTFAGVLLALVAIVSVSYLVNLNFELLQGEFALSSATKIPVWSALLVAFLLGFLPTVGVLLAQTLRRDLSERRARRVSRQAKSLEGGFRRAVDFWADGQWQPALDEIEAVLAEKPQDFSGLLLHGEVLRRIGSASEALEVHRRASVLYPRSVAVLLGLAADYESLGDRDVADQVRDRILRDFPGLGLRILRLRRDQALAAGEWREAERFQERISTIQPEDTEPAGDRAVRLGLMYQRAVSDLESDRFAEAMKSLGVVLESESRFVPALILRGEVEVLQGSPEAAVERWREGFRGTGSPVFLQRIEDHFIERGMPIEAIDTLHQIIHESDSKLLPRFFLGRLFYRLEMHDEALRALQDLEEEISLSPTFHFLLARIHHRKGNLTSSVKSYLKCVQEAGLASGGFICRACRRQYEDWRDRCGDCGSWNSVELNFELEKFTPEDLGVRQAPVWAHYGPSPDVSD
jgi:lipopolysaccharide biosynthesis regulator YciM